MGAGPSVSEAERGWLRVLISTLNELQVRLFVAQRALEVGRGGLSKVSRLTGAMYNFHVLQVRLS